jgi:hypothetical protein
MSRVTWEDRARDELADIYVQATPTERNQIERVVVAFEGDLADDPMSVGESRGQRSRVEFRGFLTFWFQVSEFGGEVRIYRVLRPRRRS